MTKDWTELTPKEMAKELEQMGSETTFELDIDESKYPMTFEEFKTKIKDKIISNSVKRYHVSEDEASNDLEGYLNENPQTIEGEYLDCCEYYDDCKEHYGEVERFNERHLIRPETVFKVRLNSSAYDICHEIYFF